MASDRVTGLLAHLAGYTRQSGVAAGWKLSALQTEERNWQFLAKKASIALTEIVYLLRHLLLLLLPSCCVEQLVCLI